MKTTLSLLLIALLATSYARGTQLPAGSYHGRHFTDENGLPQNSITGMGFDNMGFVWIATQGGLARFDGREMKTFSKQKLSIGSDRFVRLKKDVHNSELYAVNEYGQMVTLRNGKAKRELRYQTEETLDEESIAPRRMNGLRLDTTKTADNYTRYRIISSTSGRYFVYAAKKVFFFRNSRLTKAAGFPGEPYYNPFPGEPNMRVLTVAKTKKFTCVDNFMTISGELFYHLGSEGSRLLHLSEQATTAAVLEGEIRQHPRFQQDEKNIRIITNRMKGQAFAVLGGSIYLVTYPGSGHGLQTRLLIENFRIDDNLVSRMLYDEPNHTLILGSFSQGLALVRTKAFQVLRNSVPRNFHNVFYAHLPFSTSSVVIPDGVVMGNDHAGARDGQAFRAGERTYRFSMIRDKREHLWIIKGKTLLQLSADGNRALATWPFDWQPERLYESPSGDIWIGSKTGEISYLKSGATAADKPVTVTRLNGECTFIYQQKPGQMWLGATDGLYLYSISKRSLSPVKGLSGKTIRSIYATSNDELWVTTYGDGMFLITGNRLIKLPTDKNGYLRHAHYIMEDQSKNFWIPSNKGLFRASREDLLAYAHGLFRQVFYAYYNKDDGFLINEFNGGCEPCGVKLPDGRYSLPSMSGLVWFRPQDVPLPDLQAPIIFENLTIGDKRTAMKDTIRLSYDFAHFRFDVRTAFNGAPENLQLYYSLEKIGSPTSTWTRMNAGQQIDMFQTNPGKYTLKVRKATGFGGKYVEKSIILVVKTAWFFCPWFVGLITLSLFVVVWLFTKWRLYHLTRQNILLGEKVEERTSHLTKALSDLKASDEALQTQLQIQMRIIGVINHDLHSPLRYLSTHVPRFMEEIAPHLPDREAVNLGYSISKSTVKVYRLADELLAFIKATYNNKGKVSYEDVPLKEILDQKALFFAEIARENQTTLYTECEQGLTIRTNYRMLEILIHNLLDNALKHTYGQSVSITAHKLANSTVEVVVSDSGYGMYDDITNWLNGKPASARPSDLSGTGVPEKLGLGLIIVKEITALLGIEITAHSSNEGTRIGLLFNV